MISTFELLQVKNLFQTFPNLERVRVVPHNQGVTFEINGIKLPIQFFFPLEYLRDDDKAWLIENDLSLNLINAIKVTVPLKLGCPLFNRKEIL